SGICVSAISESLVDAEIGSGSDVALPASKFEVLMRWAMPIFLLGALLGGCSDDGAASDGGAVDCGATQAKNDPACPAMQKDVCAGTMQPCSHSGLTCMYPGQGDGPDQNGCFATAIAACRTPPGVDGGATIWTCAQ